MPHYNQSGRGFETLKIAGAHLNNQEVKHKSRGPQLVAHLLRLMETHEIDILYTDANQAAHARDGAASLLEQAFTEEQGYLQPPEPECRPLWGRTATAVLNYGACTGFVLRKTVLASSVVWKHGMWAQPPSNRVAFTSSDKTWHCPSFVHLQSHSVSTGRRIRTLEAKRRRRMKYEQKKKGRAQQVDTAQGSDKEEEHMTPAAHSTSSVDQGDAMHEDPPEPPKAEEEAVDPDDNSVADEIRVYYRVFTNRDAEEVESLLQKYQANPEKLLAALQQKYGSLPTTGPATMHSSSSTRPPSPARPTQDTSAPAWQDHTTWSWGSWRWWSEWSWDEDTHRAWS